MSIGAWYVVKIKYNICVTRNPYQDILWNVSTFGFADLRYENDF
jgi:hypothetical protein